ncbi:MAG: T9SS type A sorting domain-containing protein, partial [Ignavibacteria bacterium]|nr:T9SS type A sorting domain-containing protein [Ignavibacteria bacterium]
ETIAENSIPGDYKLLSNYPNPFNPQTTIKFIVDKNISGIALIKIYNSAGILVDIAELFINGKGVYQFVWKAEKFSSGVYFYSVDFGDEILFSKMLLLK